ncbi:MAG: hypothetical protein M1839_004174 [Geoglossum umbratile]|nr:MAG: hypothetical protein M1839_004174 [Geoglossum umbratile]
MSAYRSTLREKNRLIGLLLAQTTLHQQHGYCKAFKNLVQQDDWAIATAEIQNEHYWSDSVTSLSRSLSHLDSKYFEGVSPGELKTQLGYLIWDLTRQSVAIGVPLEEPIRPKRVFLWQENWLLYCWALEIHIIPWKLPETFMPRDFEALYRLLYQYGCYTEGKMPGVDDVLDDIQLIRSVFGENSATSIASVSEPNADPLKASEAMGKELDQMKGLLKKLLL